MITQFGTKQNAGHWTAAATHVDITPDQPMPLAGWTSRKGSWTRIADPLEANLLSLRQGDERLLWISFDLLYVGREVRGHLEDALGPYFRPEQIFLCASHTHFAPAAETSKPNLGAADPAYLKKLMAKVILAAQTLIADEHVPVTLTLAKASADHTINRRRSVRSISTPIRKSVIIAPNFAGPRDETVNLLRVDHLGGKPIALVWHYACHPVGFPDQSAVSADFPGVVRQQLRERVSETLPVLYCQGFSGDIRPKLILEPQGTANRLRQVFTGSRFGTVGLEAWQQWSGSLAGVVKGLLTAAGLKLNGPLHTDRRTSPLSQWVENGPAQRLVSGHTLHLGTGVIIRGVSAEPVVAHSLAMPAGTICIGCIDDVYGYLPTDHMLTEGGYEVEGFLPLFGLGGRVLSGTSERLVALFSASPS